MGNCFGKGSSGVKHETTGASQAQKVSGGHKVSAKGAVGHSLPATEAEKPANARDAAAMAAQAREEQRNQQFKKKKVITV